MNPIISKIITQLITNPVLQNIRFNLHEVKRNLTFSKATIHYFHQPDDPYSQLSASFIAQLQQRYKVQIQTYLLDQPSKQINPDQQRLNEWAKRDAAELTKKFNLTPVHQVSAPNGTTLLHQLGHYSGAMFYFEGEWYWGIDRLHYLEKRLMKIGLSHDCDLEPLISPPPLLYKEISEKRIKPVIHFFCSLRSPYTWLALDRIFQLAEHYQAELKLRFVLPMVMRGLPVPIEKRLYILLNSKREANRLDLPFGCVVDPVGLATKQGLAVLHHAIQQGKGNAFLHSFLKGVFADGVDAASMKGLHFLADRAGISVSEVTTSLNDESCKIIAEENRKELLDKGLWGVPSFYVEGYSALWGQDRIWMLERDLIQSLSI